MDSYSVNFKPSVQKDLRPLPKALVARVMERIEGRGRFAAAGHPALRPHSLARTLPTRAAH